MTPGLVITRSPGSNPVKGKRLPVLTECLPMTYSARTICE
jgi:hypothetical protein